MKELKIGHINYYQNEYWGDTGIYRFDMFCEIMNKLSSKYHYIHCNCLTEECDIVFYSVIDRLEKLQLCKGNPTFILWTDELLSSGAHNDSPEVHPNPDDPSTYDIPFKFFKKDNLSISFFDDSESNCYFPYAMLFHKDVIDTKLTYNSREKQFNKTKFATFCASQGNLYQSYYRNNIVKYISDNYKIIDCCGSFMNNMNGEKLSFDELEARSFHDNYKFNICYENTMTSGNCKYITEKIMKAYAYNVIPIYRGSDYIEEIFNKDSFINCNGLTDEEILERIKEVDENEELYNYMLNQWPFKYRYIDYELYFYEKVMKFIESKL